MIRASFIVQYLAAVVAAVALATAAIFGAVNALSPMIGGGGAW